MLAKKMPSNSEYALYCYVVSCVCVCCTWFFALVPPLVFASCECRTMWGFLRVENEHLRIYGSSSGGTPDGSGSPDPSGGEGFKRVPSYATVSTMAGGSSINSSVASTMAGGGLGVSMMGGGGGGGVSIGRASGLDRLPYTRMGMPSSDGVGGGGGEGLLRRLMSPCKAWCLLKVRQLDVLFGFVRR